MDRRMFHALTAAAKTAIDLSLYDVNGNKFETGRNTANCYVIKKTGKYKIPLVYGNAIKNNEVNDTAYTNIGRTYNSDFVNYLDEVISNPYIEKDTNTEAKSGYLVWQTAVGMITDLKIIEGDPVRFIQFKINEVPTRNGNAVIAIKDKRGNIMWSWHLWLNADTITAEACSSGANFMSSCLGWIKKPITDHPNYGIAPYYQWGRKDPIIAASQSSSTSNQEVYDIDGVSVEFATQGVSGASQYNSDNTVANAIKTPNKFFIECQANNNSWIGLSDASAPQIHIWNFWDQNAPDTDTLTSSNIKTIYDPSPAGWKVPYGSAYSFCLLANVIGSFDKGYIFKRTDDDETGIYFPALGYRNYTFGDLTNIGSYGSFWSSAPNSVTYSYNFNFNSSIVNPTNYCNRTFGLLIRPIQD